MLFITFGKEQIYHILYYLQMNLVIDIGNSRIKLAVFGKNKIKHQQTLQTLSLQKIELLISKSEKINSVILASVTNHNKAIFKTLKNNFYFLELSSATPIPFKNKYTTPKTLGNDRLANMAAAVQVFPQKNVLVIDAGTCLKFDFIDAKKNYKGGAISPGLNMRFRALHHFTGKLPLVMQSAKNILSGNSTRSAIISGVQNGMLMEMQGVINQYQKKYNELKVILTGGDAGFFANHLKSSIFVSPNLTLVGLNEILNYNVEKNFQ